MTNKYLNRLNWAVFTMIDRSTQDDRKSKINVAGFVILASAYLTFYGRLLLACGFY